MTRKLYLFQLLLLISAYDVSSQPPQQPLQPLGDVLLMVLDKDKDKKVTMSEINAQMAQLENLFQHGEGPEADEYRRLLLGAKAAAPKAFQLLDSNRDDGLSRTELRYVTKFEKSLKKGGGMKELLRDVFATLDADGDDRLGVDELAEGSRSDEVIAEATSKFHALFPIRKSAKELESFVRDAIGSIGGGKGKGGIDALDRDTVAEGMKWIDDDGDGYVQRKEVGKYYNAAGRKFLEISKTIKQMGPMLAMFGGMDMGGGFDEDGSNDDDDRNRAVVVVAAAAAAASKWTCRPRRCEPCE
eukprot:CAMPEP_0183329464 /NCGR_PEP_ID=MMETSP0160_2-20130417/84809_1 /TAXON_ID=2839 ORGANISM="Odontella Sinensis, Strain Grunow 1884" /NCGR_SAMPLE_ID=MMETSP0160_2 /ASSEMBLY_ACC=CAM_ASM_000250 /LENGTH=299 /DNA_ID=CAMNT_0025497655 /DNA_START=101 /DNA_END=1001 /DNA_ORIENTATION=-